MKNVYKWRATNVKYVYLTDVDKAGPFIFDRTTGIKTFVEGTSTTSLNEDSIKNQVSKFSFGEYSGFFSQMVNLCATDEDCSRINFSDVSYYYNVDGDECAENPPAAPCECYIPKWVIDETETLPYDQKAVANITNVEVISSTKEIVYHLYVGIPQGKPGEDGGVGATGRRGETGEQGRSTIITEVGIGEIVISETAEASVTVGGTEEEMQLFFNFGIPKGERGDIGEKGDTGDDGANAELRTVNVNVETLDYDEEAYGSGDTVTIYDPSDNTNYTDLNLGLFIPKGRPGDTGPVGPAPVFDEILSQIIPLTSEEAPSVTTETVLVSEGHYKLKFIFRLPQGIPGEKGDTGPQGPPGITDYYYGNGGGGTGGGKYVFEVPVYEGTGEQAGHFDIDYDPDTGINYVTLVLFKNGGGANLCEGDGITLVDDIDSGCTVISANSEAITVDDIEIGEMWGGGTIPSGTTIQSVLETMMNLLPKITGDDVEYI